jgi:hypothetical protein
MPSPCPPTPWCPVQWCPDLPCPAALFHTAAALFHTAAALPYCPALLPCAAAAALCCSCCYPAAAIICLTVVSQDPHGLSQGPLGGGVGAETPAWRSAAQHSDAQPSATQHTPQPAAAACTGPRKSNWLCNIPQHICSMCILHKPPTVLPCTVLLYSTASANDTRVQAPCHHTAHL